MAHAEGHHGHHIVPKALLYKVFGALVVLTIVTVLSAQVDLGVLNVPLALAIAGSKAALVVLFFMALKYDNRVNTLVFAAGSIFVVIFIVFTLFDTVWRGEIGGVSPQTITDELRATEMSTGATQTVGEGSDAAGAGAGGSDGSATEGSEQGN